MLASELISSATMAMRSLSTLPTVRIWMRDCVERARAILVQLTAFTTPGA